MAEPIEATGPESQLKGALSRRTFLARGGVVAGALALGPSLLAACGGSGKSQTGKKRLVIAIEGDPKSLNEIIDPGIGIRVLVNTQDGLLNRSADYRKIVPGIAKSLPELVDPTTYKFAIRDDIKFQNGDPVTVDDIIYSLMRLKTDPKVTFGAIYRTNLKSVTAPDKNTIIVKTNEPFSIMQSLLSGNHCKIVSRKIAESPGYGNSSWSGTGPFEITEWVKGDHITMKKASKGNSPQGEAHIDEVVWRVIPDVSARTAALRAGQVDAVMAPQYKDLPKFKDSSSINVIGGQSSDQTLMFFKTSIPPFDKREVRKAISLGINRQKLVDDFFYGHASVSGDLFPLWHWAHDPTSKAPYDPGQAKDLLKAVGFGEGKPLKFTAMILQDEQFLDEATAIQAQLKDIGVEMTIKAVEYTTLSAIETKGPKAWLGPVAMARITPLRGTAYEFSYYQYGTQGALNMTDFNKPGGYQRPDIEKALVATCAESDWSPQRDEKVKPAWAKLCKTIEDDPPELILNYWDRVSLVSKKVHGWTPAVFALVQVQPMTMD